MKKTSTFSQFKNNKKLTQQEKRTTKGGYKHYEPTHVALTLDWIEIDLRRPSGNVRGESLAPGRVSINNTGVANNYSLETILFGQP